MKKILIVAGCVIAAMIVLVGLKSAGAFGGGQLLKVQVARPEARNIVETVNAVGKIFPEHEVTISPEFSGQITGIFVKEGDRVKKGQLLVTINPDIYIQQEQQAAFDQQAEQYSMQGKLAALQGDKSKVNMLKQAADRSVTLYSKGAISRADMEKARGEYENALSAYHAASSNVNMAAAKTAASAAAFRKSAIQTDRNRIVAPADGFIGRLNVKVGEQVAGTSIMAGTELMSVASDSSLMVVVEVSDNDVGNIQVGDTAIVALSSSVHIKYAAAVIAITGRQGMDANVNSNGAPLYYKVKIRLLQQPVTVLGTRYDPGKIVWKPGMTVVADILTSVSYNVMSVPVSAVVFKPGKAAAVAKADFAMRSSFDNTDDTYPCIFTLGPNSTVMQQFVTLGTQNQDYVEVKALAPNALIVTGPSTIISAALEHGMKVKIN